MSYEKRDTKLKDVGALWNGKPGSALLFSGEVELSPGVKTRLLVFKNKHKTPQDRKPDFRICIEVPFEDETQAPGNVSDDDVAF